MEYYRHFFVVFTVNACYYQRIYKLLGISLLFKVFFILFFSAMITMSPWLLNLTKGFHIPYTATLIFNL